MFILELPQRNLFVPRDQRHNKHLSELARKWDLTLAYWDVDFDGKLLVVRPGSAHTTLWGSFDQLMHNMGEVISKEPETPKPQAPKPKAPEPEMDARYKADPVQQEPKYKKALEALVGMAGPKKEVLRIANMAEMQKRRKLVGLPVEPIPMHMVFTGRPGTGKTTFARIIAEVLFTHGMLPRNHLVETDRAGLVGAWVGQSEERTEQKIKEAQGSTLFIDEFQGLMGTGNDFGPRVIDVLVKRMEDMRDNLCIIVAGYTEPMKQIIASNPGLKSRFTRFIHFPDYTNEELTEIFDLLLKQGQYQLTDDAYPEVFRAFSALPRGEDFGNAREVRNFYKRLIEVQAERVIATKADLTVITREDVAAVVPTY